MLALQLIYVSKRCPRNIHHGLTHWGKVTHICIIKLSHHWFRPWLVAWLAPSHYLNQCWNNVNRTPGNIFQSNFKQNTIIFIEENAFQNVVHNVLMQKTCNSGVSGMELHLFCINTLRPRQNGQHLPDGIFNCILLNQNVQISMRISLMFIPKGSINNIPALDLIMASHHSGEKPLSRPMVVNLLMNICVICPQWFKPSTCI